MGRDPQCGEYIAIYGKTQTAAGAGTVLSGESMSLGAAIERGLKEQAGQAAARLLETREALDGITGEMIPALDRVGPGVEKGTIFLPQLLMSVWAATAAVAEVQPRTVGRGSVVRRG